MRYDQERAMEGFGYYKKDHQGLRPVPQTAAEIHADLRKAGEAVGDARRREHNESCARAIEALGGDRAIIGELVDLVRRAYERFTDNDFHPPNHALSVWLDQASAVLARVKGGA